MRSPVRASLVLLSVCLASGSVPPRAAGEPDAQRVKRLEYARQRAEANRIATALIQEEMERRRRIAPGRSALSSMEPAGRAGTVAPATHPAGDAGPPAADAGLGRLFRDDERLPEGTREYPLLVKARPARQAIEELPVLRPLPQPEQVPAEPPLLTPAPAPARPAPTSSSAVEPVNEPVARPTEPGVFRQGPGPQPATPGDAPPAETAGGVDVFHNGYSRYSQGDYARAVEAFRAFIRANPRSDLADNAQYWIGQCAFDQGDYRTALDEYGKVVDSFPFGDRVPEAMLKSALSLQALHRPEEARQVLMGLIERFPDSGAARRARTLLDGPVDPPA